MVFSFPSLPDNFQTLALGEKAKAEGELNNYYASFVRYNLDDRIRMFSERCSIPTHLDAIVSHSYPRFNDGETIIKGPVDPTCSAVECNSWHRWNTMPDHYY